MQHNIWILTLNLFIVPSVVAVYAETLKVWFKTSGESEAVAQLVESALTLQAWCPPGWGEPAQEPHQEVGGRERAQENKTKSNQTTTMGLVL